MDKVQRTIYNGHGQLTMDNGKRTRNNILCTVQNGQWKIIIGQMTTKYYVKKEKEKLAQRLQLFAAAKNLPV